MKTLNQSRVVKLLRAYRQHNLGMNAAWYRLGQFKQKHKFC